MADGWTARHGGDVDWARERDAEADDQTVRAPAPVPRPRLCPVLTAASDAVRASARPHRPPRARRMYQQRVVTGAIILVLMLLMAIILWEKLH